MKVLAKCSQKDEPIVFAEIKRANDNRLRLQAELQIARGYGK